MLGRPRQGLEVLSISALDLFASALGVFVLVAVLMFPYYLRSPSVEIEEAGATAAFAAAGAAMVEAEREAAREAERMAAAEEALSEAERRMREAEAAATALAAEAGQAEEEAVQAVRERAGTPDRHPAALTITDLDLVMVLDATGSMAGELADLRASLLGIIRILARLAPTLRIGFVAYKDQGEPYVTRAFPLTAMGDRGRRDLIAFVQAIRAKGGGDIPEPVDTALEAAIAMDWRAGAEGRILVIGDAPAKVHGWQRALDLAEGFRASSTDEARPRSVSTILTGDNPGAEPFFRALAQAGGGETVEHQGAMIESVLVQVLRPPEAG